MYKVNGYFPVVRCVCGRVYTLKRATVCLCGVTLRAGSLKNRRYHKHWRPYGVAPDAYDVKAQPYRFIIDVGWANEQGEIGRTA